MKKDSRPLWYAESVLIAILYLGLCNSTLAAEHRIEDLNEKPSADVFSERVSAQLAEKGIRVLRGTQRVVLDLWLCKRWPTKAGFQASDEVLYPFQPGQLIGAVRLGRKGRDFRDNEIPRGTYTLRYAQQPIDGNHEGTFPTRDFLLLVPAQADKSAKVMDSKQMIELSTGAIDANHPAMIGMVQADTDSAEAPAIRHDEDKDWWIVKLAGQEHKGGETKQLHMNVVVAGSVEE